MSRLFNLQHAAVGAVTMAFYAAVANVSAGFVQAASAAGTQAALSFLIVGANTALFAFVLKRQGPLVAVLLSTLVSLDSAAAIHALAETANYTLTLLLVAIAAFVNFSGLTLIKSQFGTINLITLLNKLWGWFTTRLVLLRITASVPDDHICRSRRHRL